MAMRTEVPHEHVAVRAFGCSECPSLSVMLDCGCVRCQQVDYLLHVVAELHEEVEQLRSIMESKEEIGWWP